MPEHTIPESLIEQIRAGRAVLVVGAGIGLASWKQLLERMNEELERRGDDNDKVAHKDVAKLLHKGSLGRAAGFLARALGEETCDRIVKEVWQTPDEIPDIPRALARLPFREVWSVFPGDVLEHAFRTASPDGWPDAEVLTWKDAGRINPRRRTLLKILGDFDSYIVTPRSVRRALSSASALREHARDYYANGALVFVGFRFGDPDLGALLDRVFGAFEPPESAHYLIASGVGPVTVDELSAEHHIEVVNLEGKGADDRATAALVDYLESLEAACTGAGITLEQDVPAADDLEGWLEVFAGDPQSTEALDALDAMTRAADEAGDSDRLIDILVGRVEHEPTPQGRAQLLRRLAGVFETAVGDLPQAFTALTAALREDPADTTSVDEAERLADDTDGWAELVQDVSAVAGEIQDPAIAAGYWARLGRWYADKLHHHDYAVASYRQALKLDSELVGAHAGLAELYRKQQRWAELADVLSTQVELEKDAGAKVDLYLALGDLQETQLASTARAIESYQAAADLDPSCDDALNSLERLYRRDERWGKLARVLERRAELFEEAGETARASATRRELATMRADKLGDMEGAIARYEATLESDPDDVAALRSLEDLYEKVGRTDDYLRVLERLTEVGPEGDRAALIRRLAVELEDREGGRDQAIALYERLIELEPSAPDAYASLERVLRADARWYDLASTYERHIATLKAPAPRVELYLAMGELYDKELDDPHRAIEGYLNALSIDGDHRGALEALARLYERVEAHDRAVDILVRHAELEGNRAAPLWHRAGVMAFENLGDPATGEQHLEKALALDPGHLPSLQALARLHESREAWGSAIDYLERAEQHTSNRLERVELLVHAADLAADRLEDDDRSTELLLRVLKLDPDNEEAGTRVVERLIETRRWQDALPVAEMLARHAGDDHHEKGRREASLGRVYEALGDRDKAATHYRAAVEADRDNLEAALGLVSMLLAEAKEHDDTERWAEVDRRYREILMRHKSALADGQVVEIWHNVGVACRAQGEGGKAVDAFRRALERDPRHASSLDGLIQVAGERGDWKSVALAKRDQIAGAGSAEKLRLLEDIGDLYREKLGDGETALGAYLEGLALEPSSHTLLHKSLDIYTEKKQWRRAMDTLAQLAEHEADQVRRAKYFYAAAVIARDELGDAEAAVDNFERVLEDAPDNHKAFDAIDRLLGDKGDWKRLARAYRRMLKRMGEEVPVERLLRMWTRLGDICLDHLGDNEAAIAAYEVASSLEPDDMGRHEQLANLYLEAGESRRADAIDELQVLIRDNPDRVELYRALSTLYQDEHEVDKAYCLSQALVFLGAASDGEKALFNAHRPQQFVLARRRLTEELWQKAIIHQRENRHLNAIFSSLIGSIASTTAQPANAFNLSAAERADAERDSHLVSRMFKYATGVLAIDPQPNLYLQPQSADGIRVANTAESGKLVPSVLVGNPHVDKRDERELAFEVGKRLAYFRPERYVNYALQTLPKLESAFAAALTAAGTYDGEGADVEKMADHIRATVPGAVLEQVGVVAGKLGGGPGNGLITGWRTATDLTANRVGFILSNDLETAARLIATEKSSMSTLSAKDRLRDVLAYAVSEEYFAVRRHLGLTVREES